MKGKYYLSQILTPNRLKENCINVIKCHTGAGKTHFVFKELPKYVRCNNYILYITDTNMNKEQVISTYKNAKGYFKDWRKFINDHTDLVPYGWGDYAKTYITTMNYAQVGAIIHYKHDFDWSKFDFIVCDELHNLINYQNIRVEGQSVNILSCAKTKIDDTLNSHPNVKVIGLTATPDKVYKSFTNTYDVLTPQEYNDLYCYETFDTRYYKDCLKIFSDIPQGVKGIVYFQQINDLKKAEQFLIERGHKTISLWSIVNPDHIMTDKQLEVRTHIIKNQLIPNDIDILLINSACETGVNIKNNDIYFMVIHSDNSDTITQVRGRLRNDLQVQFIYSPKFIDLPNPVPQGYLNRPLTIEERKQLCNDEIRLLKPDKTPYQWEKVKEYLENNGYKVTKGARIKGQRTFIIEKS